MGTPTPSTPDDPASGVRPDRGLLRLLPESSRSALLALGEPRHAPTGTHLINAGDDPCPVLLLVRGVVKISLVGPDGRCLLLGIRHSGDLIGQTACLTGCPARTTATASGPVALRMIPAPDFLRQLGRDSALAVAANRRTAERLWEHTRRWSWLTNLPVRTRAARLLAELVIPWVDGASSIDLTGEAAADRAEAVPLSQSELASLVGAAEISVHRALAELRALGAVRTGYREVRVHDRTALLRAAVDGSPSGAS